jgi:prepilin-type N-terminal cleavage/methylation domain-containing protein
MSANGRPRRLIETRDAGVTLIEVLVSLTVLSVVMSLFTAGIIQMYRSANKTEAIVNAQNQIVIAFQRLDKDVRYAAGISREGMVGSGPGVEYLIANTGSPMCVQLRLKPAKNQLQRRTWPQGSTPPKPDAAAADWAVLANDITGSNPFTFRAANSDAPFQSLRVRLSTTSGGAGGSATKQTDITFTALNTSLSTVSAAVCTEGR